MHYLNVLVEQKCPFYILSQSAPRGINVAGRFTNKCAATAMPCKRTMY